MNAKATAKPRRPRRTTDACPDCSAYVVNVQGLAACPECNWTEQ